jgi:hypothetical protein
MPRAGDLAKRDARTVGLLVRRVLGVEHGISVVRGRSRAVATHVIFLEVDDVEHWLSSPKREEVFGRWGSRYGRSATRRALIGSV